MPVDVVMSMFFLELCTLQASSSCIGGTIQIRVWLQCNEITVNNYQKEIYLGPNQVSRLVMEVDQHTCFKIVTSLGETFVEWIEMLIL